MSNTTDLMTGSSGMPEESPAVSGLPGEVRESTGSAGTSPESAGAVRSWPEQDALAGEARRADQAARPDEAQSAGTSRRGGTGLSAMLLPELCKFETQVSLVRSVHQTPRKDSVDVRPGKIGDGRHTSIGSRKLENSNLFGGKAVAQH